MVTSTQNSAMLFKTAKDIDDRWLGEVLGIDGLSVVSIRAIGTGQMSQSHRVRFDSPSGLGSVVVRLEVEPLAFGALRLVAPDGRVTHFPRAMARVRTVDGRSRP